MPIIKLSIHADIEFIYIYIIYIIHIHIYYIIYIMYVVSFPFEAIGRLQIAMQHAPLLDTEVHRRAFVGMKRCMVHGQRETSIIGSPKWL